MIELPFFVYGTLRRGQGNHHLAAPALAGVHEARLRRHCLYAAGLPYVSESRSPRSVVIGELLLIRPGCYETARADLDRLEGYQPPGRALYVRRACRVEFRDEPGGPWRERDAWVYHGGASFRFHEHLLVPGGDWVAARPAA